jgi:hypothetical protein
MTGKRNPRTSHKARELFYTERGRRRDAELHKEILPGEHSIADAVGQRAADEVAIHLRDT